jgi:DNA helicase HerA-like ATPase
MNRHSDQSHADVEPFLREKLMEIKEESDSLDPRWPEEWDFWKIANAAGGLFAYAQTVIRYVGDRRVGSPASQLSDVLRVIDKHPMAGLSREEHPMALLDALYERILSNVPDKIMNNTL